MTTPTQPKPTPVPAILVYGTPSGPALTQASWFRAEDKEAVKAAAKELKFSVIELHTDADRALAAGAHEGVLKGSGRMIVGSVSAEVYRRIEEHVRKGAGAPDASKPDNAAATTTRSASEQNKNIAHLAPLATEQPDLASAPNPWEALRVGARVLAAYWNEKREFEGFWLATVKRIENGEFTLEWFDAPEYPPFKNRGKKCRHRPPGVPRHRQVARASEIATTIIVLFAWGGLRVAPLRSAHALNQARAIPTPTSGNPSHDQHHRVHRRTHPRPQRRLPPHLRRRRRHDHRRRRSPAGRATSLAPRRRCAPSTSSPTTTIPTANTTSARSTRAASATSGRSTTTTARPSSAPPIPPTPPSPRAC